MISKYIHTGKVIGQRFERTIVFGSAEKITEAVFYGLVYSAYGFNKNGNPLMLKIQLIFINETIHELREETWKGSKGKIENE